MDNKENWKRYLSSFKEDMMYEIKDPIKGGCVWWDIKYAETIYESPKTFKGCYAFNDGSWLKFPKEYRTNKGMPKAIFLKTTKDVIKELAFFCRFQRLLGVSVKEELVYHMLCFICDVIKIYDNAFNCNEDNKKVLDKIANSVLNSDASQEVVEKLKDKRKFCIDPKWLIGKNNSAKARLESKGRRMSNYIGILKKYDIGKSISQNAVICGTSISTIKRFKKHKAEVERYIKENRIEVE